MANKNVTKEECYDDVLMAMAYVLEKEKEDIAIEEANHKASRILMIMSLIGGIVIIALSQISYYSFNFSWMSNASKWYSDIFISFSSYIFILDVVFVLQKFFKLNKKVAFVYTWPIIGFIISLILTNSITVELLPLEHRASIAIFTIALIPSSIFMIVSYKTGRDKGRRQVAILERACQIIKDNPDTVKKITKDVDNYSKTKQ